MGCGYGFFFFNQKKKETLRTQNGGILLEISGCKSIRQMCIAKGFHPHQNNERLIKGLLKGALSQSFQQKKLQKKGTAIYSGQME